MARLLTYWRDLWPFGILTMLAATVFGSLSLGEFMMETEGYRTGAQGFIYLLGAVFFMWLANQAVRKKRVTRAVTEQSRAAEGRLLALRETINKAGADWDMRLQTKTDKYLDEVREVVRATGTAITTQCQEITEDVRRSLERQEDVLCVLRQRIELLEARQAALESTRHFALPGFAVRPAQPPAPDHPPTAK